MRLRFSIGILFSLTLHFFLIVGVLRLYPGLGINENWKWGSWNQFPNKKNYENRFSDKKNIKFKEKITISKIIFPDIVLIEEGSKNIIKKKYIAPSISIKSIILEVNKFPQNVNLEAFSNKKLSGKVGEIIDNLVPVRLKDNLPKLGRLNLNSNELKQFRKALEDFLSKKWEVPMHLRESDYSVFVQLEIEKNGRLLNWEIKQSSNILLEKTLKKLLKSLQFLPALPKSYHENSYKFGIKFTPLNLK